MSRRVPEPTATEMQSKPETQNASSASIATATAITNSAVSRENDNRHNNHENHDTNQDNPSRLPTPKLRLEIRDLNHNGAGKFLSEVRANTATKDAIRTVLHLLYDCTGKTIDHPPVRSITLILRSMDGVAYTTGNELDDEHKEIHLSLDYIDNQNQNRFRHETLGVLVHEMVHVWQWNGNGFAPGGLIEGIADFVRLKAGYAPPHWKREPGKDWDAGYDKTGFFLEWLENVYGAGKVVELNGQLKKEYSQDIWKKVYGRDVKELFKAYCDEYEKEKDVIEKDRVDPKVIGLGKQAS